MPNTPLYRLQFKELINVPKNKTYSVQIIIRNVVWAIVAILFIGSLFFKENLFGEMTWTHRVLLIALAISVSYTGGKKKVESEAELWFYSDYLVLYREKRYCTPKVTRKQYEKFLYDDIEKIIYRNHTNRINIEGRFEATYYNYKKQGIVSAEPNFNKTIDSIAWFYPSNPTANEIITILEHYTNHKVEIQEG